MKIHFDKLYKDERKNELLGIGVPFPKGELTLKEYERLAVIDSGKIIPSQIKITSTWEDGSIRFIYVRFLGTLPGNAAKDFVLVTTSDMIDNSNVFADGIDNNLVTRTNTAISVSNGVFNFRVADFQNGLFQELSYEGHVFTRNQFIGPVLKMDGYVFSPIFELWQIVENGPIFTIIEASGHFEDNNQRLSGEGIKFTLRLSITCDKPWIEAAVRIFNCTLDTIEPDELTFEIRNTGKDKVIPRTTVGISNFKTKFETSDEGEEVSKTITAELLEREANEHFAEVFYGTFLADVSDFGDGVGICATVFQAQQNYPKAISASSDGIKISLLPDKNRLMDISNSYSVRFESGMAREQRFLLHFHDAGEDLYELNNRSIIYQMPDTGYVDPEIFEQAGVFPEIFLPQKEQIDDVEIALIDKADSHARCYGILNWGDAPDPGYTSQGRGGGNLVWTNNEYDYPHAMYMMYARTGIRRMFDYANVACWHWMDVDICHYNTDPLFVNGQWEHQKRHSGSSEPGRGTRGIMACSHEWVEGLLDHYHFTGDERALETAIGIGRNVLALLDTPAYQVPGEIGARETGWALRSLTALYIETHDKKWLEKADWIVGQFEEWNDKYGNWLSAYTDNTTIRVGFMISVAVGSLMRYYRVDGSERVKQLIMKAIDDIVDNCRTPNGLFYYKELPSLARNGNNTLLLESMAIGYELTKEDRYLDYGLKTFYKQISSQSGISFTKRIVEDTVMVGNGPTKNFAQSFLPLTLFYVKAVQANKLLQ